MKKLVGSLVIITVLFLSSFFINAEGPWPSPSIPDSIEEPVF